MAIRHILFDLDNTLYPAHAGLMAELDRRIARYFARELKIRLPEAQRLQAEYCWQYGSCTSGVLRHVAVHLEKFLNEVHGVDVRRYLSPDPGLSAALDRLAGRKWVFTNAPAGYALRVLDALGVTDRFHDVFDISFLGFIGKPDAEAYHRVLAAIRARGVECAIVEDSARNLRPAKALHMTTILLSPNGTAPPWVDAVVPTLHGLPEVLRLARRRARLAR